MSTSEVYCELKRRILLGELVPGKALQEHGLAEEFGVSRTPVREALIRLETEGLVRIVPKQGVYVTEISFDTFRKSYEIRYYLVGLAGELAALRITDPELENLDRIVQQLRETEDGREIQALDQEFHDLLNAGAHNDLLAAALQRLRAFMPRVTTHSHQDGQYFVESVQEHTEILAALRERDGARAADLLRRHVERFRRFIEELPLFPSVDAS